MPQLFISSFEIDLNNQTRFNVCPGFSDQLATCILRHTNKAMRENHARGKQVALLCGTNAPCAIAGAPKRACMESRGARTGFRTEGEAQAAIGGNSRLFVARGFPPPSFP